MQSTKMIVDIFRHMAWADAVVWRAVLDHPQAEKDTKCKEILYHYHATQHAFFLVWQNLPLDGIPEITGFDAMKDLAEWGRGYHEKVMTYLGHIKESDMNRSILLPWSGYIEKHLGKIPEDPTLEDTMLQVVMHTMHHRGQVNARLRAIGVIPELVDYIAWIWIGKPDAVWPA
ncbi:MAG: DinB family protein [Calditrichaceae bacterium]